MSVRIYIDLETTGLHPSSGAKIVEIAAVAMTEFWDITDDFKSLVHPGDESISRLYYQEQVDINNIKTKDLMKAPQEKSVAFAFKLWLEKFPDDVHLHSYNVSFEEKFLSKNPWNIDHSAWGECIMLAAQKMMRRDKWPKLEDAMHYCSVSKKQEHRAYEDAMLASEVHRYILDWRDK